MLLLKNSRKVFKNENTRNVNYSSYTGLVWRRGRSFHGLTFPLPCVRFWTSLVRFEFYTR